MTGNLLLDTNLVIALFANDHKAGELIAGATGVFVPAIVLGELFFGARKSGRPDENIGRIADFAARTNVLACDEQTAFTYGIIKDSLWRKGTPIPENDVWIAAVAIQRDLALGTRDAHFSNVDGLRLVAW
jgi:tRNA(fMet)-specific endonuclease VapC